MKIVIAPAAFKGSLSPLQASRAMELGVRSVLPQAKTIMAPVADGGDGTMEAILYAQKGETHQTTVSGPLGNPVQASWAMLEDGETAVIEMAVASGLALLKSDQLDPLRATTYGVGELVKAALDRGRRRIVIGLGVSATVDGGAGMAQSLGVRFLDRNGLCLPGGGGALSALAKIDVSGLNSRIRECQIIGACDVATPSLGCRGRLQCTARRRGPYLPP